MGGFGFLFNEMDSSDRVLRIEIRSQDSDRVGNDSDGCSTTYDSVVKVTTLNISSLILASESSFFYKLFENGMKESHQKEVTLRIDASEEAPLMDILNAMYINNLSATTTPELLGVLMVADKFEVVSCMRYCSSLLEKLAVALEYEPCYPKLPSLNLMDGGVEPLKEAAKDYIVTRFMDFNRSEEEAMGLPLCALEIVLGSDGLRLKSEEDLLDFMVRWGRAHYPLLEERREILTNRLARFIYFQHLNIAKRWNCESICSDFDAKAIPKLYKKSLRWSAGFPYGQCTRVPGPYTSTMTTATATKWRRRVYEYHLVKVEHFFYSPHPCTNVYLHLTRQECTNLVHSRQLSSQAFYINGLRWFRLLVRCNREDYFGLFLHKTPPLLLEDDDPSSVMNNNKICTIACEFQVIKDPSKGFESEHRIDNCTLTEGDHVGTENLFGISWNNMISPDDSPYFIDGVLHLRVQITFLDNYPPQTVLNGALHWYS